LTRTGILTTLRFLFAFLMGLSRVEKRRRDGSLPVAINGAFAPPPQSGLAWLYFLFPLIEPDRQISRIRLSEKTHVILCDAVCNF
jgi:hypothetical protein